MKTIDLLNEIDNADSIAISGHVHPDADCVGSTLALYNFIVRDFPGKNVTVYLLDPIPQMFRFLGGYDKIKRSYNGGEFDLFIFCDASTTDRLADLKGIAEHAQRIINIDHHIPSRDPQPFDDAYSDPEASSTCELVYDLLGEERIDKTIAECLYTGIVGDTGVFQYSCCHRSTMLAAGVLMDKGIDPNFIIDETFYRKTFTENRMMGRALSKAKLYEDGEFIASYITKAEMKEENALSKHMEGIVNQLRITKGVRIAIFMYEIEPGKLKGSLRTNDDTDLTLIAGVFGGGGHKKAAGFTSDLPFEETVARIIEETRKQDV